MTASVPVDRLQKDTVNFKSNIRRIFVRFDCEADCELLFRLLPLCAQVAHPPLVFEVRDFFSGKLNDLTPTCRDLCKQNNLYPEECDEHFDVLCEILRSVTKKKYATITKKREQQYRLEHGSHAPDKPKDRAPNPDDDVMKYCRPDNPRKLFTNFVSIGKGGFGEVFCAQRVEDMQTVALKVLKHTIDERYAKIGIEVSCLRNWHHENIVGFEGCWLFNNQIYVGRRPR